MNKNFTQPFDKSDTLHVSVFVRLSGEDDSSDTYVLKKFEDDPNEALPFSLDVKTSEDVLLAISKELYDNGLAINYIRKVTAGADIEFSLGDDTPGTVKDVVCYYAEADLINKSDDLLYISYPEFVEVTQNSSFLDKTERAAAKSITN